MAAMIWVYNSRGGGGSITVGANIFFPSLPFTFFRLVFPFQINSYYNHKSTKRRTLLIGFLADMSMIIYAGLTSLPALWDPYYMYVTVPIPIPILILVGWFLISFIHPIEKKAEWLDEERKGWWPKIRIEEEIEQ
jgi:ABC-type Co2+ transport system permease subunit